MENGFQGKDGQTVPQMTPEVVEGISNRYIELYENIVGEKFEKPVCDGDIAERIRKNVEKAL